MNCIPQRKGVLKKTIDGDELRRRRESTANEIRKNKRNETLQKRRGAVGMTTAEYRFGDDSTIVAQKVWKFSINLEHLKLNVV